MANLALSIAVGNYDRTRPLLDRAVLIDGVDPIYMCLSPEEMFFRAMRQAEFDVSELSLSSYLVAHSRNQCPYIALPVFLSRAFRHTSFYVRKDRIIKPQDLVGKRVGVPEFQLTANVWARAILKRDYRVGAEDITWVRGGIDVPGRPEKLAIQLSPNIIIEDAPENVTISHLLDEGRIDGFIAPRPPNSSALRNPHVGWLFDDPTSVAKDWYKRSGIFPIMHVLGVRKDLAAKHPWLPGALLKAFTTSKHLALRSLADTSAPKVTLPFVEERLKDAQETIGNDFWSYGVEGSYTTLDAFLAHHHAEGLSTRRLSVDEIFHRATYETYSI